jgi:hypothetical protein
MVSKLRVQCFAISIDGYGAGPNQDLQNPLGVRGSEVAAYPPFGSICAPLLSMNCISPSGLSYSAPGSIFGTTSICVLWAMNARTALLANARPTSFCADRRDDLVTNGEG